MTVVPSNGLGAYSHISLISALRWAGGIHDRNDELNHS